VLNVLVTEIVLDSPCVMTVVGEFVARGVTQHVRMHSEAKTGSLAGAHDDLSSRRVRQRTTTFRGKNVGRVWIISPHTPQGSDFRTTQRMDRCDASFEAMDVKPSLTQIDLVPLKSNDLRDPQAMAVGDEDERAIAMSVPSVLASCFDEPLDFLLREILPWPNVHIPRLSRR
jgi:hypothetical protein